MANSITHAALPYPIKGARYTVLVPLLDADGDPTAQTTPDTELSEDGAAAADATEEVTAVSGMDGMGYITFTGAETDCTLLAANFKAASGPKATLMTIAPAVLAEVGTGTLSAGSAGGGTLGTLLAYDITGCFIKTTGGTGGGGTGGANNQARKIVTYNTSTGAFTVTPNWETTPDNTTTYAILLPEGVTLGMLRALNPTTAGRTLDVSSGGEAGVDWANVGSPTTVLNLSGTTVKTATDVETDTADIQSRLPAALVGGRMDANVGAISADASAADNLESAYDGTGYAHTGNTYPWTPAWDAEVQSEVDDALVAQRLDELLNADSDIDGAAPPTVGSVFHELMSKTAGSFTFDQTTDSLEAVRDRGDAAWVTATGFSTHSAADVWAAATRTLTAATNITSTGGTTVPQTGDSFARIGATGSGLTSLAQASVCTEARLAELDAANLPADVDQVKADLPQRITKNTALSGFPFFMVLSSDHVTGATGKTVTATRSIDGAAFAACANAVTEVSNGWYKIDLAAADLNGNTIALKFTATDCDARMITIITQPT